MSIFSNSYTTTIELNKPPETVFRTLQEVSKWWGGNDLEGNTANLNDEFIIDHPGAHYSKQRVVELIPDIKIVWEVTDSTLNWLVKNQQEWTHTRMIFELTPAGDNTILQFTHQGLVPQLECYERVSRGWDMVIKDYLFNYVNQGTPHFT